MYKTRKYKCNSLTIIFIMIVTIAPLFSQVENKQDYVWLFGGPSPTELLEFNFNNKPVEFTLRDKGLDFDSCNTSISDTKGNLLVYSNGCAVADRFHNIMPNGRDINEGNFQSEWWMDEECKRGYPGRQDILILPDPGNDSGYYLIHKTIEYDLDSEVKLFNKDLKYSYIDLSLNNSAGDVTVKNKIFFSSRMLLSYLTAIHHENLIDWWILQPGESGRTYYRFLLTSNGIAQIDSQEIGNNFVELYSSAAGDAKFSPDGSMYAFFNLNDGLFLFDFNRNSGQLSNFRHLAISDTITSKFASIEFSPDSRFVYLAATDTLWQVDTWEEKLEDGKILIDT